MRFTVCRMVHGARCSHLRPVTCDLRRTIGTCARNLSYLKSTAARTMARASQKIRLLLVLTLVAMLLALVALPWRTLRAAGGAARPAFQYFPATGHNLGLAFKQFYEAHGGLPIFGLPLTEVISQDGMQVQYFERARLELHLELPAARQVALARLGSALTEGRTEPAFAPRAGPEAADRTFFPATGHTLGGAFGSFWQARGQLPVFGYPISEEFAETSVADGRPYMVQYFERARFEYHPEHAGTPDEVQLGHLGRAYARARGLPPELL